MFRIRIATAREEWFAGHRGAVARYDLVEHAVSALDDWREHYGHLEAAPATMDVVNDLGEVVWSKHWPGEIPLP